MYRYLGIIEKGDISHNDVNERTTEREYFKQVRAAVQ